MDEDKLSTCRVCLNSGNKYMSLFERLGSFQVYKHIMFIATVTIAPDDELPAFICPGCVLELQTVITFKDKCEASDRAMRAAYLRAAASRPNTLQSSVEVKKEEDSYDEYGPVEYLEIEKSESDNEVKSELLAVRSVNEKTFVQCDDCQQFFKSKCKLRVHWKKEHKQKTFVCQTCRRLFKTLFAFNKHNRTYSRSCTELKNSDKVRVDGEGKRRTFHCTQCEYKSDRLIHLRAHVIVHMPGERPFKCQLCPSAYTQRGSLKEHMDEQHDGTLRPTCHVCGKVVRSRRRLYRHLLTHREATLPCPVCSKLLKSTSSLKNHMKRHSGSKEYTCEVCAATFFTQAELCNHRRLHHLNPGKQFKCSRCEFQCSRKSRLQTHEIKHSGDKEFPCPKCGKFYESLQHLQVHLLRFHKPKRFKCPTCSNLFCSRKSARRHMRDKHSVQGIITQQILMDAGSAAVQPGGDSSRASTDS